MNLSNHDIKNTINQEAKQDLLYIDNLNGDQFENYMTHVLNHVGYHNVIHTPYSNDHGADAVSYTDSISWQFKNYKHTVPFHAVEEVMFSARYYHTKTNVVLTNSYFSNNTINTVNKMNNFNPTSPIILIDRPKLLNMLTDYEAHKPAISERLRKQQLHKKENRVLEAYKYNKAIEINIDKSKQIYNFKNRAKQFAFYALKSIIPYKNLLLDFEDVTLRDTYYNIINHILNAKVFRGKNWSTGYINNNYPYGHQDVHIKYYGMIIKHPIYYKDVKAFMYIPIIYYPPEAINMYKDSPQELKYPYQNMMLPWNQLTKPFRTKHNGFLLNKCCIISNCIFNPWSPNNAINNNYTLLHAPNHVSINGNFSFNDARTIYLSTHNNSSNNIREAEQNFIQHQLHKAKSYERGVIPNNIINEQTPKDLFHKLREIKNKTLYKHWKVRNKAINKKKKFQHEQEKNSQQMKDTIKHQINDISLNPYKYHQEQKKDNAQVKKHTQQLKIKQEQYNNKYNQIKSSNEQHNFKSDNKISQNNSINSKAKNIVEHIISHIQNKERY